MLPLVICFLLVLADQVSKHLVVQNLRGGPVTLVPGLLEFRYIENTGAAWGVFQGASGPLVIFSALMLGILLIFRQSLLEDTLLHRVILGCMLGGIVGNMIDRIRLAYVVDFIYFHWKDHYFPAFNVADSAICIGVGLYILTTCLGERRRSVHGSGKAAGGCESGTP